MKLRLKQLVLDFLLLNNFVHSFYLRIQVGLDILRLGLWSRLIALNVLGTSWVGRRWRDVGWWLERSSWIEIYWVRRCLLIHRWKHWWWVCTRSHHWRSHERRKFLMVLNFRLLIVLIIDGFLLPD